MNAKELAALLHGVEYGREYSLRMLEVDKIAKANGLVIAVGESDDLLEFYGAFREEVGAWDGTTSLIDAEGVLPSFEGASEDEESMRAYLARKEKARTIEAVWCEKGSGYAWILKTDIPHETFSIIEDGEGFSRGIVFALADLVVKADPATCQGANCHASQSNDYQHSPECIVEAAACQGWSDAPGAVEAERAVAEKNRADFEDWVKSEPFFALWDVEGKLERDDHDGGYLDANAQAAWLAWNKRGAA